ncbi:unnamed protein product [Caenorhabditis bovis]|uniref:Autophagy-related protein 2 n=1 Tax=Caenorhabditis bovis TaxID=2654633 RepID=A0A8S1EUL8_9PELO|nr:unnamed protein product [Caenorhabditis bovis]
MLNFNITERLKEIWCRTILQRCFGRFLLTKLTMNDCSLNLGEGKLEMCNLYINVEEVNKLLPSSSLTLADGFIGKISMAIPWSQLLAETSDIQLEQLQLTFFSKESTSTISKDEAISLVMSFMDSLKMPDEEMSSSSEESIESFSTIIDVICSRIRILLVDSIVRIETPPTDQSVMLWTALEVHCETAEFLDDTNFEENSRLRKKIMIEGVSFYTDIFSDLTKSMSSSIQAQRELHMSEHDTSSSIDAINAEFFSLICNESTSAEIPRIEPNSVRFARIAETIQVAIEIFEADNSQKRFRVDIDVKTIEIFAAVSQFDIIQSGTIEFRWLQRIADNAGIDTSRWSHRRDEGREVRRD